MASTSSQSTNNVEMTKIHICPATKSFDRVIRQYFGQFGKVESIVYYSKKEFGYAFVRFDSAELASAAIAESEHNIWGRIVKVKAAHSKKQTPSVSGLSKSEKLNGACPINKLNEDCLREIFEHLNIYDLLSTADVCNQFREVATDLIKPSVYSHLYMSSNISWPLLRLFATEVQSIHLDFRLFSDYGINLVLDRIASIGSNPNSKLTKISISEWITNEKFIKRLKPLFSRITSLSIYDAAKNDETITEVLNVCTELKELELADINFAPISKIKFPKLETLIILETPGLNDYVVNQFLSSHRQLKTLSIYKDLNAKLTSNAFRNLNSNIEKLELFDKFELSPNLDEFNGLTSLKSLAIDCCSVSLLKSLVKKGLPIEELHLSGLDLDGSVINDIKSLKHLKKLKFCAFELGDNDLSVGMVKALPQLKSIDLNIHRGVIGIKRIKEMVKSAPELEYVKFHQENGVVIDSQDFESILESVRCCQKKTKLTVDLFGRGCQLKVPKILIEKNREWLTFYVMRY